MRLIFLITFLFSIFHQTLFAKESKEVSLQLNWKHQFEFAGYYIAKEKGFYKDIGLNVTIKEFDFGIDVIDDITSGKSTFGTNYPSLILEKSKGKDIVLLSAILQSSPHALITLESSGINSLKDFKNKTMMIDKGAVSAAPFVSMLQSNKVSFDEIKKVPHTFDINDLINKKVDISAVFTTNEPYHLQKKNIPYKIWDPKEYGFDFYDALLFSSSELAEENPKLVTNFRDASLKGWQYAFSNIDETVELILNKYNSQNKTKEALLYEAKELKKLAFYKNKQLGDIDSNAIQRIFDVYNLLGLTEKTIDIDTFIYKSTDDFNALRLTKKELDFIRKHPIIKVGGEMDWPPFDYVENGTYTGIAKDYLDLIEKYTGLEFDIITGYSWDELLKMGKSKQLDVMPVIYYTKDREKYFNYTDEYLTVRNYLFSLEESGDIYSKLEDLNGKTIAFPKGFAQIEILKKEYPKIKILETKNPLDSLDAVITKRADAMIENIALVSHLLKQHNIQGIKSDFTINMGANSIYMTSRKDWPILRNILQKGLDRISAEEKLTITNKWMQIKNDNKQVALNNDEKLYLRNNLFNIYLNNWLPISIYNEENKEFSGLSLDYWNKIKEIVPINDKLVYTGGFLNSINNIKNDSKGMMISLSATKDREEFGAFSKPYASYPIGIATKDKESFILDLNELEGKTIAVGKNYSAHKLLQKNYPKIKFVPVKNTVEALELLAKGKVYGAADILLTLKYYLQTYSYTNLKVAGTSDFKFDIRIMVNKENAKLIPIINKAIDKISENDKKIFQNKWVQTVKRVETINYTLLFSILSVSALIILTLLWRHKELARYKNALEEKTTQLHDYVEVSSDYVWEIDTNGTYIRVSDQVFDILGYTPAEMIGKSSFEFMPKNAISRLANAYQEKVTNKEPIEDFQNINIHKNGSRILLLINGIPVFKDGKLVSYRGTGKDITKEKQKDLIIIEQSKMAAMGEMLANIAHQWRQPLSVISTSASGAKMLKELNQLSDEQFIHNMDKIVHQTKYLSETIDTFRNFIKEDKVLKEHPIEDEVTQAISIIETTLKNHHIKLKNKVDFTHNTPVKIMVNELSQVIINIINNAKDVILEKDIVDGWVEIDLFKEDEMVTITIEDNGGGIPSEIIQRIFEPYFTTKHQSQGTGLGLHMSYKIITESLNGKLYTENTKNGAKFFIEIPL